MKIKSILSILIIICLTVLTSGCRSPESPNAKKLIKVNSFLEKRKLPLIPQSAKNINYLIRDNFFNERYYLRFEADEIDVYKFMKEFKAEPLIEIEPEISKPNIITYEEALKRLDADFNYDSDKDIVIHDIKIPWFKPQIIKKGKAFIKEYGDTGVKVFFDQTTNTVYFYWHYS